MTIFMKFILLASLILLFYFFNQRFIMESFSLAPNQGLGNIVEEEAKHIQSEPVRTEGGVHSLFLLPQESAGSMVKKTTGSPFGSSVSADGDLSSMTFLPQNKPGESIPNFLNISLKSDKKLASVNEDCVYGCEFQCEDESCLTDGDIPAIPINNDRLKKEVVFNTLYHTNFRAGKGRWTDLREIIIDNAPDYGDDPKMKRIINNNQNRIKKKYDKKKISQLDISNRIAEINLSFKWAGNESGRSNKRNKYKRNVKRKNKELKDNIKKRHFKNKFLKKICDKSDSFRFARLHKILSQGLAEAGGKWITEENIPAYISTNTDNNKDLLHPENWLSYLDSNKKVCINYLKSIR
jgi:hypothetical protein